MDKKIVVANWKMNPTTVKEAEELFDFVVNSNRKFKNIDLIFCPPFVYLSLLNLKLKTKNLKLKLGAQDMHWEAKGAYTGEISPLMLKDIGINYVIIGHSERRYKLGETDEVINKKIKSALKHGLTPVIAVGEKERTNFDSSGKYINTADDIVVDQLSSALNGVSPNKLKDIVVAYEPVWAISTSGTGLVETPDGALSVALLIRKTISKLTSIKIANSVPVLYGGSVDSKNVTEFVKQEGIDGVLVGGASIDKEEFVKMMEIIES